MPLYEYECDACHHRFEIIQKFSDPPADRCPKCGSTVHKMQSAPAFQFKGSGWYVTDYAKKDSGNAAKSGDEAKPAGKDAASEKSDKPADTPKTSSTDKPSTSISTTPATKDS